MLGTLILDEHPYPIAKVELLDGAIRVTTDPVPGPLRLNGLLDFAVYGADGGLVLFSRDFFKVRAYKGDQVILTAEMRAEGKISVEEKERRKVAAWLRPELGGSPSASG